MFTHNFFHRISTGQTCKLFSAKYKVISTIPHSLPIATNQHCSFIGVELYKIIIFADVYILVSAWRTQAESMLQVLGCCYADATMLNLQKMFLQPVGLNILGVCGLGKAIFVGTFLC